MAIPTTTTTTTTTGVPLAERLVLTVPEAAELSGIPLRNLKAALAGGTLPACTTGSSRLYIRRTDLDDYIKALPEI